MADDFIQLPEDEGGKKVDAERLTVGPNVVYRQRTQITGENPDEIAPVSATEGLKVNLGADNDVSVSSSALPTGAATAANQLPDGHNVAVSSSALPTGAATAANQLPDGHNVAINDIVAKTASGNLTATAQTVELDVSGYGVATVQFSGTWSAFLFFEMTTDGSTWSATACQTNKGRLAALFTSNTDAGDSIIYFPCHGVQKIRINDALHLSGTVVVSMRAIHGSVPQANPTSLATSGSKTSPTTGSIATLNTFGFGALAIQLSGTWTGSVTFEGTLDETNWFPLKGRLITGSTNPTYGATTTENCIAVIPVSGLAQIRANATSLSSGTVTAKIEALVASAQDPAVHLISTATGAPIGEAAGAPVAAQLSDGTSSIDPRGGNVAHDAADSGNPVKVGAKAVNHASTPSEVASGDRTDLLAHRSGVQFVIGGHPNTVRLHQKNTAAQTDQVLKTINTNERFVVTSVLVISHDSTATAVQVLLEFDDATDVPFWEHPGVPAGGGASEGNGAGILAIGGKGQDVLLTNQVPTGGSITVHVSGYVITET